MKNFFTFTSNLEIGKGKQPAFAFFIFPIFGIESWQEIESVLDKEIKKHLVDTIIVAVPKFPKKIEKEAIDEILERIQKFRRLDAFYACNISHDGNLTNTTAIKEERQLTITDSDLKKNIEKIISSGLGQIVAKNEVANRAPLGLFFQKNSNRASNYFIRAANIFYSPENVYFCSFCLLSKFLLKKSEPPDYIFIDSMSIFGAAIWLAELIKITSGQKKRPAHVISFHSYEGLKNISTPPPGSKCLCIISASTSGGLPRIAADKLNLAPQDVVTIFSFTDSDEPGVLFKIERPKDYLDTPSKNDKIITVKGEDFLFHSAETKVVELAMHHEPKKMEHERKKILGKNIFNAYGVADSGKRKPFSVKGEIILDDDKFKEWLVSYLLASIPLSISHIIYQDESSSKVFAEKCLEIIKTTPNPPEIAIKSSKDIIKLDKINGSILVVGTVIREGTTFQSINRDLRNIHKNGRRIFLSALTISNSEESLRTLKSNLEMSAHAILANTFHSYSSWICEKHNIVSFFDREKELLSKGWRVDSVAKRINLFRPEGGLSGKDCFNTKAKNNEKLELRNEFVFGGEIKLDQADVLLIMTWILQNARSNKDLPEKSRISSNLFVNSVLNPETFARYNDGIIQAAILRAAGDEELDYRSDSQSSSSMLGIIKRIFDRRDDVTGEAVIEFLIAICIKRIRLSPTDEDSLVSYLNNNKDGNEEFIRFLIDSLSERKEPFKARSTRQMRRRSPSRKSRTNDQKSI